MHPAAKVQIRTAKPIVAVQVRSIGSAPTAEDIAAAAAREEALREQSAMAERERCEPAAAALAAAADQIAQACRVLEERAEPLMIEIVKKIASEVLRREVDAGRYDLSGIVRDCLAAARGGDRGVTVCLHPTDLAASKENGWLRALENNGTKVRGDAAVGRASCRLETPYGTVTRDIGAVVADVFAAVDGRR
ncbi:MAG: hypothetical protein JNJ88_17240 [Planctomycetes bacterium]|nr:hypothetical protein [Planctomycetota bacterium]